MRARPERPGVPLVGAGSTLFPHPEAGKPQRQLGAALLQAVDLGSASSPGGLRGRGRGRDLGGKQHRRSIVAGGGDVGAVLPLYGLERDEGMYRDRHPAD